MLLTVQQYAEKQNVDSSQVRRAIQKGFITAISYEDAIFIDPSIKKRCRYIDSNEKWLTYGNRWKEQLTVLHPRLYNIWGIMKQRCNNPNASSYSYYGGKGIKVCKEWANNSRNFIEWSLSHGYRDDLEIDRIDCSKDYCPENCRWVTKTENLRNRKYKRDRISA